MGKRFMSIWFCNLKTDWFMRHNPALKQRAFVLAQPDHGRSMVTAVSGPAIAAGIAPGITVADARAIVPGLTVLDDIPELCSKLLRGLAEWCVRFTPVVATDAPDGLLLDISGCAHLWGGEAPYAATISKRLQQFGYTVRIATADTTGTAWAVARYGRENLCIPTGRHTEALLPLPPAALRLDTAIIERLQKLGLATIRSFISMPRTALRRRFGTALLEQLDKATGETEEALLPVIPLTAYSERLPCLEPIVTATGIEIALKRLLHTVCTRLQREEKGLRSAVFKCYRSDERMIQLDIGTNRPTCNAAHLYKLFEIKTGTIEPGCGIELFVLEALQTATLRTTQETLWTVDKGLQDAALSELLDRVAVKTGQGHIFRYVPDEHYWPERSFKAAAIDEVLSTDWPINRPRPLQLLPHPEAIEVTAPVPDYPPMLFRYKGVLHKIIKADGPERIEQEWWLQEGQHRDYYAVEDESGNRYWLFRSGHYDASRSYQWFIHGFFA